MNVKYSCLFISTGNSVESGTQAVGSLIGRWLSYSPQGFSHPIRLYYSVSVRSYGRVSYAVTDVNCLSWFVNISALQQQIFIVT